MLEKIVILGNQFICEKRICNIVQKTISVDSNEVENYLHLHKFFKDQRAIVVSEAVTVSPGYIFNGAEFVNPISMTKYPIDGDVIEEELDTSPTETEIPNTDKIMEIVKRLESWADEMDKRVLQKIDELENYCDYTHTKVDRNFVQLGRPRLYKVIAGSVYKRSGPSTQYPSVGFAKKEDIIEVFGYDRNTNFGVIGPDTWITLSDKYLKEVTK